MPNQKVYRAIGLMSGTSLDGVDAALIETDGRGVVRFVDFLSKPYPFYDETIREAIRGCFGLIEDTSDGRVAAVEQRCTDVNIRVVQDLLKQAGLTPDDIDVIGYHGQTIHHDPDEGFTWQIGDGARLARESGIQVVYDFRSLDMEHGGEGAPLLPLYHHVRVMGEGALAERRPCVVLNIGGVSNLTFIDGDEEQMLAYDLGPGNALLDDFMVRRMGMDCDLGGALAARGIARQDLVEEWMEHPFFKMSAPKSLDRQGWDVSTIEDLGEAEAAATLTAFTVEAIAAGLKLLPRQPACVVVCGGGQHNDEMMRLLDRALGDVTLKRAIDIGWNGDSMEAEGFAYYAVRSLLGLPISYPNTTGVSAPLSGGQLSLPTA